MEEIDPGRPEYVYAQVANAIEQKISSGQLRAGARLPGELDLAEQYGVAAGTIRRALVELRERGLVVTLPAKGTYVTQTPPADKDGE
ncbi:winged helix-turn-helix domain-containing protein [Streptomyces sp. CNQ085]|uniref:GntR family transcriptional regulator n=1 Tax=Streptomyces sp. CNQ085 TaxID=2886944 RepID=UPI001F50E473|nr:winged helix-turn-helix domain-containing protein [Streptomyces sp. CNQ085]MCI0384536.1 winged helix-turn-helix domain-containing protein [Streptomyces sp. CNQ085]